MLTHQKNERVFLFLQGPHGPFFHQLGKALNAARAKTYRIGFNSGDRYFWRNKSTFIPFQQTVDEWPAFLEQHLTDKSVTDIVLYGDVREVHARAVEIAKSRGITIHVFEEGYIRPYWATYERDGANGHSRLMDFTVSQMREALERYDPNPTLPPSSWGDMRQHVYYGALYHAFLLLFNRKFRKVTSHRDISVKGEFLLYLRRLLFSPFYIMERNLATYRVRNSGFPYHLVLLQLEHDSSFQAHSNLSTMVEFVETVIQGFADGAPGHHHLVFKAHPLEDGRTPLLKAIRKLAVEHGIKHRIHFIRGGKLAHLLDEAKTAVTINSTAGQQVLWRGLPLKTFGASVYGKPEFISHQPLEEFFTNPHNPDRAAYVDYRRFLLESSQLPGGFYSSRGRRQLLRRVVDMMLSSDDPYDRLINASAAPRQHMRVIHQGER